MPIDLACSCGWQTRVKDEYAGKRAKCPSCAESLTVPAKEVDVEEAAAQALLDDDGPSESATGLSSSGSYPTHDDDRRPTRPAPANSSAAAPPKPAKKIPIKYKAKEHSESGRPRIVLSAGVVGGLGMMLLGGLICALGLANDRFPIYGGILLFLGLLQVIRGIMGKEED